MLRSAEAFLRQSGCENAWDLDLNSNQPKFPLNPSKERISF